MRDEWPRAAVYLFILSLLPLSLISSLFPSPFSPLSLLARAVRTRAAAPGRGAEPGRRAPVGVGGGPPGGGAGAEPPQQWSGAEQAGGAAYQRRTGGATLQRQSG